MFKLTPIQKELLDICIIDNELKLIESGFCISEYLGKIFLQNSITSFVNLYLYKVYGKDLIPVLSMEYRYFILGILIRIKDEFKEYAINEILIPKFGKIKTDELLSYLKIL
jgi:hypothetical protein